MQARLSKMAAAVLVAVAGSGAAASAQQPGILLRNDLHVPFDGGAGVSVEWVPSNLNGFGIVINPGPTLAANGPALAAFQRAADSWAARISDPITVTINADLGAFVNSNTIGSTSSTIYAADFDQVRSFMALDAADEPADLVVASLPTSLTVSANVPAGKGFANNVLFISRANVKAIGLDPGDTLTDAQITFNEAFSFDYDRSDSVTPGLTDFETVAQHEIGHALGFFSAVDQFDNGATVTALTTLDLFRFDRLTQNPSTFADFATFPRDLRPGNDDVTDDLVNEYRMSTGVNTPGADGRQASHWKADELTGVTIGILDPTLAPGQVYLATEADFRALSLIGYDVAPANAIVPEPASLSLLLLAAIPVLSSRPAGGRRRASRG